MEEKFKFIARHGDKEVLLFEDTLRPSQVEETFFQYIKTQECFFSLILDGFQDELAPVIESLTPWKERWEPVLRKRISLDFKIEEMSSEEKEIFLNECYWPIIGMFLQGGLEFLADFEWGEGNLLSWDPENLYLEGPPEVLNLFSVGAN